MMILITKTTVKTDNKTAITILPELVVLYENKMIARPTSTRIEPIIVIQTIICVKKWTRMRCKRDIPMAIRMQSTKTS